VGNPWLIVKNDIPRFLEQRPDLTPDQLVGEMRKLLEGSTPARKQTLAAYLRFKWQDIACNGAAVELHGEDPEALWVAVKAMCVYKGGHTPLEQIEFCGVDAVNTIVKEVITRDLGGWRAFCSGPTSRERWNRTRFLRALGAGR